MSQFSENIRMKQKTLKESITFSGIGLHTGTSVEMTIHPAPVNHGYKFKRTDLNEQIIPADVNYVVSTNRGTTLQKGEAEIHTVEHVLSALSGMEIDNALIDLTGPEVPILDGSSQPYVDKILKVGTIELDAEREYFVINEPITYRDEEEEVELMALPSSSLEITCLIDFQSSYIGHQYASIKSVDQYVNDIAKCRTFVFLFELEKLLEENLIKGGDLNNAIVIANKKVDQKYLDTLAKKLGRPTIKVEKQGILNTTKLYFENEPARHKLLDIIGDLALLGKPIKGRIVANKPGHTANVAFAKILKKKYLEQRKLKGKPNYDPSKEPLLNIEQIKAKIPHRFPFLLVDKIIELSEKQVVGIKNISFDQLYAQGHFPGNPLFPGVLQIEALAQTGGILALSTVPDPENWDTLFIKIDNTKFKNKVVPGDTLILKMELLSPIRRGICQMYGTAYVGNKIVSEGELTAQIIKRKTNE